MPKRLRILIKYFNIFITSLSVGFLLRYIYTYVYIRALRECNGREERVIGGRFIN